LIKNSPKKMKVRIISSF